MRTCLAEIDLNDSCTQFIISNIFDENILCVLVSVTQRKKDLQHWKHLFLYFRLLRTQVLALACGNGLEDCLQKASQLFQEWLYNDKEYAHSDCLLLGL